VVEQLLEKLYTDVLEYLDTLVEYQIIQKLWEEEAYKKYREEFENNLTVSFSNGGEEEQSRVGRMGIGVDIDIPHPYALERAKEHAAQLITHITDTTRERINALIAKGLQEGIYKGEMIKTLQTDYAFSKYRAQLVVNTELGNAFLQ
jgi:hypothetical protein